MLKTSIKFEIVKCLLLVCLYGVNGIDVKTIECKGLDMKLTEQEVLHMKTCGESVGVKTKAEMTLEKFPCFAKCIFEKKEVLDNLGKPHKEHIDHMFTDKMPDDIKEGLRVGLTKCLDDHAAEVDPKDESCGTYVSIALCIHSAYMDVCH